MQLWTFESHFWRRTCEEGHRCSSIYDTIIYQTISINVQAASEVNYLFVKTISIFTRLGKKGQSPNTKFIVVFKNNEIGYQIHYQKHTTSSWVSILYLNKNMV